MGTATHSPLPIGFALSPWLDLGLKAATPIGNIFGQFIFGWLADVFGRKRLYGVELLIIIVATFAQALAGQALATNVIGVIIAWRFILGVGIGGDYPLSAVISSEFASTMNRGRLMTAVFANQGWGQLSGSLVAVIVVAAYKDVLHNEDINMLTSVDTMWRIIIGFGCVPGVFALYFRLTIPETPRFTLDIERNVLQAAKDVDDFLVTGGYFIDPDAVVQRVLARKATRHDFLTYFSKWENARQLVGCAYSWFALDFAFYGLNLNWAFFLEAIGFGRTTAPTTTAQMYSSLIQLSIGNVILSVAGYIPGYWASFFVIDRWGRKPIQLSGFIMLTILFIIIGIVYDQYYMKDEASWKYAMFFLYCLANFFQNFGPNTTTFILPGESFATRYRSTCHGICAASGKLGAVISQIVITRLLYPSGNQLEHGRTLGLIVEVLAAIMFTGVLSTLIIKETNQRTLEDISNEKQEGFVRGIISKRF